MSLMVSLKEAKARRKSLNSASGDNEEQGKGFKTTDTWRRIKSYHSKVLDEHDEDVKLGEVQSNQGSNESLLGNTEELIKMPTIRRERASSLDMTLSPITQAEQSESILELEKRRGSAVLENGYTSADIDNLFSFATQSK
eukprot:m.134840 g.134840  ORF g.134840 m.134840 type:complete len:140 (-) comp9750_c0_seq1:302-721(-)